ncbi:hypothetical protein KFL_004400030 [Klebsormidium nitens]|uniref:VLRF1 domain-containing protein n=1 Tax=Klebsormidium nitens TaxID=105231 RepID=A0A1Y1IC80_KLENI|nr:hypothetical protein KFL_004400030 [Klebsormidium nitens]|eukprot:GAQ88565.1 hypothetical protein KFL_004400030 [Klebsormidium nitens]
MIQTLDQSPEDPSHSISLAAPTKAGPKQLRRVRRLSLLRRKEKHLVILLTSAAAALCIWEDGQLVRHKVITAYTVRAKQGKSQLNHMRGKTGGGLSVGGSLRMQETARLFIRVNEKLTEWADALEGCGALFHSGPIRAWNEVFSCRDVPCPLDRRDPRWVRVGLSTQKPRLKELQRICYILSHGAMGPID